MWFLYLGLPLLLLVVVGWPLSALIKLCRESRRNRLHEPEVIGYLGFLYNGYKPAFFFWEIAFVCVRKVLLSYISVFFTQSELNEESTNLQYQQGLTAMMVFICSIVIQFTARPYEDDRLNTLDELGLVVGLITLYLGNIMPSCNVLYLLLSDSSIMSEL